MENTKTILVLGRNDSNEAMRVTAGLSIADHRMNLIFMIPVPDTPENTEMIELLEFSDIESKTLIADETFPLIGADELASAILSADEVISI